MALKFNDIYPPLDAEEGMFWIGEMLNNVSADTIWQVYLDLKDKPNMDEHVDFIRDWIEEHLRRN